MEINEINKIRKYLENIIGFTASRRLDTFSFGCTGNGFNNENFTCRFYPKYFNILLDEFCCLSRASVFGLGDEYTWLLRKRLGVFDGRMQEFSDIAKEFGKGEKTLGRLYYKACAILRMKFIDYAFEATKIALS